MIFLEAQLERRKKTTHRFSMLDISRRIINVSRHFVGSMASSRVQPFFRRSEGLGAGRLGGAREIAFDFAQAKLSPH
jgi:hypothetical protein